jgi:uncharacterized protein (TIGR03435 family)
VYPAQWESGESRPQAVVLDAIHRLGLDLKKGKEPVETIAIDHIEKPSEN